MARWMFDLDHLFAAAQPIRRLFPWVLAGLTVSALFGAYWVTANISPLRPDTASYLYFDPSRPIGYPVFLWISGLFGELQLAVKIQMAVLAASLFFLGWAFYKWTGNAALSALFQLALLASPEMWKFSATLITEGLATAGIALWCAQLLVTMRKPSIVRIAVLALLSAASVLVKPSLVVMFVATGIAALLLETRKQRFLSLAITVGGLIVALGATPVANFLLHGSSSSGSPVARGIFQHTLFCPIPGPISDPDSAFVEEQAKPVRDYIGRAPNDTQELLKRIYTGKLRFGLIIPALGRRHGLDAGWQADGLIWKIAKERIAANPGCYLTSVIRSYAALATYKSYSHAEAKRLAEWLAASPPREVPVTRPLPRDEQLAVMAAKESGSSSPRFAGRQDFEPPTGRPLLLIWIARLLYGSTAVIGLLSILLLISGRRVRPDRRTLVIGAAALGVVFHGVFGITALIELHLTRYTVPLWPVVCTTLGAIVFLIFEQFKTDSRTSSKSGRSEAVAIVQ